MIKEPISDIVKKLIKISIFDFLLTIIIVPFVQTTYGLTFVQSAAVAAGIISVFSYYICVRFKTFY
jgi:hypothetical protein